MKTNFFQKLKLKVYHYNFLGSDGLFHAPGNAELIVLHGHAQGRIVSEPAYFAQYLSQIDMDKVFSNEAYHKALYTLSTTYFTHFLRACIINHNKENALLSSNTASINNINTPQDKDQECNDLLMSPDFWRLLDHCAQYLIRMNNDATLEYLINGMTALSSPVNLEAKEKSLALFSNFVTKLKEFSEGGKINNLKTLIYHYAYPQNEEARKRSVLDDYTLNSLLTLLPPLKNYDDNVLSLCLFPSSSGDITQPHKEAEVRLAVVEKIKSELGLEKLKALHQDLIAFYKGLENNRLDEKHQFDMSELSTLITTLIEREKLNYSIQVPVRPDSSSLTSTKSLAHKI